MTEPRDPMSRPTLAGIAEAARRIDPVFLRSPRFACRALGELLGCEPTLKIETLNPIRSFKGRGADHFVGGLAAAGERGPLACTSAGNFGRAMAYACRARGIPLTVALPRDTSPVIADRIRALGATVVVAGDDLDAAKRELRATPGMKLVEDGAEPRIAEGAGTIAVELLDGAAFDVVVVPVGDGALLGGMARWIAAHAPATRIVGVCMRGAPAMYHAWRGEPAPLAPPRTIAGGLSIGTPVAAAVGELREFVHDLVLVDDTALIEAMRLVHDHAGLVVEPSGAAGVAALLVHRTAFAGARVATVLTGGNVDPARLRAWLAPTTIQESP